VNDFVFSASLASPEYTYDLDEDGKQDENETWETVQVLAKPRLVQVAGDPTYGATKINRLTDTFTVKFNIAKFWLLIQADWKPSDDRAAKGTLSIAGYKAVVSPYTGDGTVSTSTFSPVYLTLNDVTLDPTRDATTGTHLERFGGNKELITVLDISPFGIISFTNRPGAITAPIPAWETEKQMLPNFDVDAVLQFELYYHAFGDPKFGGQRWTIRNGLFDYQEDRSMMRPMLLRLRAAAFQPEAGSWCDSAKGTGPATTPRWYAPNRNKRFIVVSKSRGPVSAGTPNLREPPATFFVRAAARTSGRSDLGEGRSCAGGGTRAGQTSCRSRFCAGCRAGLTCGE
jgi:hypothetical protein